MEIIFRQNPWWFFRKWERKDKNLKDYESMRIKWFPTWIKRLSLQPFSFNFIVGPRQVGKTTGIKLLIKDLCKRVESESIFFFDFEGITTLREFRDIMLWYFNERKKKGIKTSYIFLDEVTSIDEWWRPIKFFIDRGYFEDSVLTVSGSSTLRIIKIPERFPGRRGKGKSIEVLPLSFPEFVRIHGYGREILYELPSLLKLWEKYTKTGGFPTSINEEERAIEDLIDGIVSEIHKHGRSLEIIQNIFYSLLRKIPSPLSYHSIASELGISHRTVREYLEFLRDSLLLGIAYFKSDKVYHRKEKKFFFRDPFLLRTVSFWTATEFLESALFEHIVQEHMFRRFGEIYYSRNRYEIDCIAGKLRVEVKAGKPHRKYPKGVEVLEEEDIPRFILELFL